MSLSTIAWALLRPSSLLLLGLIAGFLLALKGCPRLGHTMIGVLLLALLAIAMLPIGSWAIATLEGRYPRDRVLPDHVDGIITLGGAVVPGLTENWNQPALTEAAERMTVFVTLARRYPEARWVFSGGMRDRPGGLSESDVARRFFAEIGLDAERVIYENGSWNTGENALFSQRLIQPQPGQTWLLITSAYHMPRAGAVFAKLGWAVTPWPVGFKSGRFRVGFGLNLPQQLSLLDYAFHEWAGILIYRLTGRI